MLATIKLTAAAIVSLTLLTGNIAFADQKIKHCGVSAKGTMEDALQFVQDNIDSIMNDVGDLTTGEKRRLRRKVTRVNLKCMDHKRVCRTATLGGMSRHIFDSAVVVCYNNIRTARTYRAFCQLADTILHEFAHTAGVDKDNGHNNGPNNDRVYRTGLAAYNACRDAGLNGRIPYNTND